MRLELIEAERDKAASSLKRMRARVELLENVLSARRVAEAQQSISEAEKARHESMGKHPLVQKMAHMNAELSEEIGSLANNLEQATAEDDTINKQAERISNEFRSTRQKVELARNNFV